VYRDSKIKEDGYMETLAIGRNKRLLVGAILAIALLIASSLSLGKIGTASAYHSQWFGSSGYGGVGGVYNGGMGYVMWEYYEDGDTWEQYDYKLPTCGPTNYSSISLDMWSPDYVASGGTVFQTSHTAYWWFNDG
jgi:hypothetical protein